MPNLLNVASRALLANQSILQTIGNNIANVNTPGYSRQNAILEDVPGQFSGSGYYGNGVQVADVRRNYDEFLTRQAWLSLSVSSSDSARVQKLTQLENVFQTGTDDLGATINQMMNAFSDVANAPTDRTARNVVLTDADETAARFRTADKQLSDLEQGTVIDIKSTIDTINSLAKQIAAANDQIAKTKGSGHDPNDLLDQRDQLISQMNQYVQTTQVKADDGTVGIFVAGSQALVLGSSATALQYTANDFNDPNQSQVSITRSGTTVPLTESALGGGKLAGLLHFQNADLADAHNQLGRLAVALSVQLNNQHHLGLDLNGNPGGDFFTPPTIPQGLAASTNANPATGMSVTVNNATQLVASQYEVDFTGPGTGNVIRLSDGQITAFPQASAPIIQVDGLNLQVTGAPESAGDRFLIKPFSSAPSTIQTAFSSPASLAVANQIEVQQGATNTGGLSVSSLTAVTADPNMTQTVTLTFNGNGTYDVAGTGTGIPAAGLPFTSGQPITFNGWALTLKGSPNAGDTYTVQMANPANLQRNAGNATAILNLRDVPTFDGAALTDGYAGAIAQIGNRVAAGKSAATVSDSIATSAEQDRTAVAGVNLDEEAAKLLQFQQAYQASAKLIQASQNIWDSLIQTITT
jgi:flagellar hook-associated protein 1 FlgK